ncbi:MAG: restriction endonuclease subunit [Flavisolibacter sp.]|nr:restriction endonuclease subunit [Flavisolibacter sp.]
MGYAVGSYFVAAYIYPYFMNQNPEQLARDEIDRQLLACGWMIQDKKTFNLSANIGVAIREFQTSVGPADYVLFVNGKPVVLIEAKREEEGVRLTMHEDQSTEYASAKLKYINSDPLPFVYESTGELTRFTDYKQQQIVQEIESRLSVCDKIEETITASLKQAEALRQSILKKRLKGN